MDDLLPRAKDDEVRLSGLAPGDLRAYFEEWYVKQAAARYAITLTVDEPTAAGSGGVGADLLLMTTPELRRVLSSRRMKEGGFTTLATRDWEPFGPDEVAGRDYRLSAAPWFTEQLQIASAPSVDPAGLPTTAQGLVGWAVEHPGDLAVAKPRRDELGGLAFLVALLYDISRSATIWSTWDPAVWERWAPQLWAELDRLRPALAGGGPVDSELAAAQQLKGGSAKVVALTSATSLRAVGTDPRLTVLDPASVGWTWWVVAPGATSEAAELVAGLIVDRAFQAFQTRSDQAPGLGLGIAPSGFAEPEDQAMLDQATATRPPNAVPLGLLQAAFRSLPEERYLSKLVEGWNDRYGP